MQYNVNNPAVKRILREVKEMEAEPSDQYHANPLEDNIFEWHFTIRGPKDTEFEGGLYHGRIILPPEYPFKPPNIVLLNESGRFEVGTKICLSISSYHPEHWQPSWSIRTVLVALISFMPTKGDGAIGAIDMPAKDRKELARKTPNYSCEKCGKRMCDILAPVEIGASSTETSANTTTTTTTTTTTSPEPSPQVLTQNTTTSSSNNNQNILPNPQPPSQPSQVPAVSQPTPSPVTVPPASAQAQVLRVPQSTQPTQPIPQVQPTPQPQQPQQQIQQPQVPQFHPPQFQHQVQQVQAGTNPSGTANLDFIILALIVAIIGLLVKKFYGL